MAPFVTSDEENERLASYRPSRRRRKQRERRAQFLATKELQRMTLSEQKTTPLENSPLDPSSIALGNNLLRFGFPGNRERVQSPPPPPTPSDLAAASITIKEYIRDLENLRDTAKNKYEALQIANEEREAQHVSAIKKVTEERNGLQKCINQFRGHIKQLQEQLQQLNILPIVNMDINQVLKVDEEQQDLDDGGACLKRKR